MHLVSRLNYRCFQGWECFKAQNNGTEINWMDTAINIKQIRFGEYICVCVYIYMYTCTHIRYIYKLVNTLFIITFNTFTH